MVQLINSFMLRLGLQLRLGTLVMAVVRGWRINERLPTNIVRHAYEYVYVNCIESKIGFGPHGVCWDPLGWLFSSSREVYIQQTLAVSISLWQCQTANKSCSCQSLYSFTFLHPPYVYIKSVKYKRLVTFTVLLILSFTWEYSISWLHQQVVSGSWPTASVL